MNQIVLSIIVALLSGVSAAVLGYLFSARKEDIFFARKKIEDLYLAIERFERAYGAHVIVYFPVMKNEITYDQMLDIKNRDLERSDGQVAGYESLSMLIHIYFPKLKSKFDNFELARNAVDTVIAEHHDYYKQFGPGTKNWLAPFNAALRKYDQAVGDLKNAAAATGRKHSGSLVLFGFK